MLQLTPHDVVNLKLNKGDASTPSLGQGIVYCIKDNAIIIAVDDVPEDGLDSPLRLEKLANEVRHGMHRCKLKRYTIQGVLCTC
jgi:hypothetical protein